MLNEHAYGARLSSNRRHTINWCPVIASNRQVDQGEGTSPKSKNSNSVLSMTYGSFKKIMDFFEEKFHIDLIQVCFIGNFG